MDADKSESLKRDYEIDENNLSSVNPPMNSVELAIKKEISTGHLPAVPHLVIQPGISRSPINLRELWRYRELFYFLTWRDVKVRYKQTLLGASWAIIQPLFSMLIFTLLFGKLAGMPSDDIPYPLFAFAGLLPWTFFANTITTSGNSMAGNVHLITKVYFPRLIIPASSVLAGLVDFAFAFGVMSILLVIYKVPVGLNILLVPLLVLLTSLLALAIGSWLAALNVRYRDIRYLVPFLIQLWMFATPIIYPPSMIPESFRFLHALNPMTGIIEAYRVALLGRVNGAQINWMSLGLSAVITFVILIYAAYNFRRMERTLADII